MEEYFNLLEKIFVKFTGKSHSSFASVSTFDQEVRKNALTIANRIKQGYGDTLNDLLDYYAKNKENNLADAKKVSNSKLVLGGRSRFEEVQLESVRKLLLYVDTILIPDPVLPWLESIRPEEKFSRVLFLKQIFMLLQLRPLVNDKLDVPAIYVFQSYEKSLEEHDEFTQNAIENFYLSFLACYFGIQFSDIGDSLKFAENDSTRFIDIVRNNNLFIGPSGDLTKTMNDHLKDYKEYVSRWRTKKYSDLDNILPDSLIVWRGLYENIAPFWHLIENSETLNAQPLVVRDSHWHYYKLLNNTFNDRLKKQDFLELSSTKVVESLSFERFPWLGNVPIEDIAMLRKGDEIITFRNRLNSDLIQLNQSKLCEIEYVSEQVSKSIKSLLKEHSRRLKKIEYKYKKKHSLTFLGSWMTIGATFAPTLAPFLGLSKTAFGLATKFFWDAYNEDLDRKELSKSLIGVLANAKGSA